jgi:hypothetical protein
VGKEKGVQKRMCMHVSWETSTKKKKRKQTNKQTNKQTPLSVSEQYRPSVTDPYVHILAFLDWSRYFFLQVAPQLHSCTHEADWTPFQTHYFSENLVAPGNESEHLDL